MSDKTFKIDDHAGLFTGEEGTFSYIDDGTTTLSLDDLGEIAEWLYVAWENVTGERYRPILISDKGYVADAGEITVALADRADLIYDDGNGLERDCE